jgi:hypothetical protein
MADHERGRHRLSAGPALLFLVFALAAVPATADEIRKSREVARQGFRTGEALYFVVDYIESKPGRTFWFIMPFNTPPRVFVHQIVLCRAVTGAGPPEAVAVLEEDRSSVLSRNHMFRQEGDLVVIAYDRGWDRERRTVVKEVFSWNVRESRLARTAKAEVEETFRGYFADYNSPYTANPGVVERSTFKDLVPLLTLPVPAR